MNKTTVTQSSDISMFSHEKFRINEEGRKYRACKWCAAEIPMNKHSRLLFCKEEHKIMWNNENYRRLVAKAREMQ